MTTLAVPSATSAVRAGLSVGLQRLRHRSSAVAFGLAFVLVLASSAIERRVAAVGAVDRTIEPVFGWIIPLLTLALVSRVTAYQRLDEAAWPAARFGLGRSGVALGLVLSAAVMAAITALILAVVGVLSSGAGSGPVLMDALVTAKIAVLTSLAYTGLYALGASFFRRGQGRGALFLVDLMLGGAGSLGALLPRGHAATLVGATSALDVSQTTSSIALVSIALVGIALAAFRSR